MDVQRLLNRARNSISEYCIEECHAYCCRKGYLVMTEKEKNKVAGKDADIARVGSKFSMSLNACCPRLQDNLCTIHKSRNRPLSCREFPIFVRGNDVLVSSRCPAAKEGKLYPYTKRLRMLGYKIVEGAELSDTEFWNLVI